MTAAKNATSLLAAESVTLWQGNDGVTHSGHSGDSDRKNITLGCPSSSLLNCEDIGWRYPPWRRWQPQLAAIPTLSELEWSRSTVLLCIFLGLAATVTALKWLKCNLLDTDLR